MNWFLPKKLTETGDDISQAKITVWVLFSSIFILLTLYSITLIVEVKNDFPHIPLAILCICSLFIIKFTGAIKFIGHCMVAAFTYILFSLSIKTGGIYSVDTISLYLIPSAAFIIIGFKEGLVWMGVCIIWIFYLLGLVDSDEQIQFFRAQTLDFNPYYYMMTVSYTHLTLPTICSV